MHNSRGRNPPYQLDSRGCLVLAEAQVGDEQDYVYVVRAGAAGTTEATVRLQVFGECPCTPQEGAGRGEPRKGFLTVTSPPQQNQRPPRSLTTKGCCL